MLGFWVAGARLKNQLEENAARLQGLALNGDGTIQHANHDEAAGFAKHLKQPVTVYN